MNDSRTSKNQLSADLTAMARYQHDAPDRECELLLLRARDEIERLRAALEKIANLKSIRPSWTAEVAREALGEVAPADETIAGTSSEQQLSRQLLCDADTLRETMPGSPIIDDCIKAADLIDRLLLIKSDAERYRFIRQGEDGLPTQHEEAFAAMWDEISLKGCWRERMDKRIDKAMQQVNGEVSP